MLKSCGARGVGVARLAIMVEKVKRARTLWAGAGGSLTEGMPNGPSVEGIENQFV
jgi:hypothetical protein